MFRPQFAALGAVVIVSAFVIWGVVDLTRVFSGSADNTTSVAAMAPGPLLVTVAAPTPTATQPSTATPPVTVTVSVTETATATVTSLPTETTMPTPTPTDTAAPPTETATPATQPSPSPTAVLTTTSVVTAAVAAAPAATIQGIAGLTLTDVEDRLKSGYDMACEGPVEAGGLLTWSCEGRANDGAARLEVEIVGQDAEHIVSLSGTVLQNVKPDTGLTADFLAFLAALPFQGQDAVNAEQWVKGHNLTGGQTTIDELSLRLYGPLPERTLDVFVPGAERGNG